MSIPIAIVDAFSDKPFTGNPAAICLLDQQMPDDWMQSVAAEMNLSETAFLVREGGTWRLRWMTPTVEVDLCGHATLASAKYLYAEGIADKTHAIHFDTRSGRLSTELISYNGKEMIAMDLPAIECKPIDLDPALAKALGVQPVRSFRGRFDYLVEFASEEAVRSLTPDLNLLKQFDARGVIVTAQSVAPQEYDYVCRGFFPRSGIDEDPVTGSAHCMLAPFWAKRSGKTNMTGYQASKRGGHVGIELHGDRVKLIGDARIVMKGALQT